MKPPVQEGGSSSPLPDTGDGGIQALPVLPVACPVFQRHFWLVTPGRELGRALALPKHSQEFLIHSFGSSELPTETPPTKPTSPGGSEGF